MHKRLRCLLTMAFLVMVALPGLLGGCGMEDLFPPRPDPLPPALAVVVDDRLTFAEGDNGPLGDVEAGTVIDDLTTVSGCWGAYRAFSGSPDDSTVDEMRGWILLAGGEPVVRDYAAIRFDVDGQITLWAMQETFGLLTVVTGSRGTYAVVSDNEIAVSTSEEYSSITDEGEPDPQPEFRDGYTISFALAATLAGDQLKINYRPGAEAPDPADVLTYTRFDCPDEGAPE